jgi:hypothetical protein
MSFYTENLAVGLQVGKRSSSGRVEAGDLMGMAEHSPDYSVGQLRMAFLFERFIDFYLKNNIGKKEQEIKFDGWPKCLH